MGYMKFPLWSRRYNLYIYIFFVFKCHCFFETVNLTLVVALNRSSLMKNCIRQMWQVSLYSISCFLISSCLSFTLIVREAWENWKEMKLYCYKNQKSTAMCISVSYINKPIYSPCRGPLGNVKVNKYTFQRCFYFISVSFSFPFSFHCINLR